MRPIVLSLFVVKWQWRKSRGDRGNTSPQMSDGERTVMHHVPPNMAEISLHKRQRTRLYLLNYVIVLFLSNISCLQLCQMFYRGQLCELYFQLVDHKQSRPPSFPSDLLFNLWTTSRVVPQVSHQIYLNGRYIYSFVNRDCKIIPVKLHVVYYSVCVYR